MFRYLAAIWDCADRAQTGAARLIENRLRDSPWAWHEALRVPGLVVFVAGARANSSDVYPLGDRHGVVIGTLFPAIDSLEQGASQPPHLKEDIARRVIATTGAELLKSYWGRYVAIMRDDRTARVWILRDPTGGLPCLSASSGNVRLFFSSADDYARLAFNAPTVNWNYLAAQTVMWLIESRDTALNEVSSVLAGECLEVSGGRVSSRLLWHPCEVATREPIERPAQAVSEMRKATRACVRSWADRYEGILHKLSGGLDSSIVLGCLAGPGHGRLTCLTYFSRGMDERAYARLAVADRCALLERESNCDARVQDMLGIARSARPGHYIGCIANSRREAELAKECGASVLMSGGGGDQLFYQSGAIRACADHLEHFGPRASTVNVALDAARMESRSIWGVLCGAYRICRSPDPPDPFSEIYSQRTLVRSDVVESLRERNHYLHPWLASSNGVGPGKAWQIHWMSYPMEYYDPLAAPGDPESVEPLVSQPIMEACLRIPTYVHIAGGVDRAIARKAFEQEVPEVILRRTAKAGIDDAARTIFSRNRPFAREMLLDGALVTRGILDREKLEDVLSNRPTSLGGPIAELFTCLSIEAWVDVWRNTPSAASPC